MAKRAGAENFADILLRGQSEVWNPNLFYNAGYPPKQEMFVNKIFNMENNRFNKVNLPEEGHIPHLLPPSPGPGSPNGHASSQGLKDANRLICG